MQPFLQRFVMPHLANGTQEVHIVFDNPGRQPDSPKAFERMCRDAMNALPSDQKHAQFGDSSVPTRWREHLTCRICKRQVGVYLGIAFLEHAPSLLRGNQKLVMAGCFQGHAEDQAWEISQEVKQPNPLLNCTEEEADTRVWLHTFRSPGSKKLCTHTTQMCTTLDSPCFKSTHLMSSFSSVPYLHLRGNCYISILFAILSQLILTLLLYYLRFVLNFYKHFLYVQGVTASPFLLDLERLLSYVLHSSIQTLSMPTLLIC